MRNNTSSKANWPYRTGGHFVTSNGYNSYHAASQYICMNDPYFYSCYVPNACGGIHYKLFKQINKVIGNRFGQGQQRIVY